MKSFRKKLSDFLHPVHVNLIEEMSQRCSLLIRNGVYKSALEKRSAPHAVNCRSQYVTASVAAFFSPSFYLLFKKYLNVDVGRVVLLFLDIFSSISSPFLCSRLTSS